MTDKLIHQLVVNHQPLPGQDSRASENFELKAPPGFTKFRFEIDSPHQASISTSLSLDVTGWFDMNIEKIRHLVEIPARDWSPVYYSEVAGARNRFTVRVFATAQGNPAPTTTSEFTVNLLFASGTGYISYVAQFPPPATGIAGHAVALRNPNLYALAIVKSGYSVADVLAKPEASILLGAGQETTTANLKDIYKTEKPALPIQILAVPVLTIDPRLVAYIPIVVKAEIAS